ncbi:unnamed protein product [Arctogadus glacialis]
MISTVIIDRTEMIDQTELGLSGRTNTHVGSHCLRRGSDSPVYLPVTCATCPRSWSREGPRPPGDEFPACKKPHPPPTAAPRTRKRSGARGNGRRVNGGLDRLDRSETTGAKDF